MKAWLFAAFAAVLVASSAVLRSADDAVSVQPGHIGNVSTRAITFWERVFDVNGKVIAVNINGPQPGLVLDGEAEVLFRNVGPGLKDFGVANYLKSPDPLLDAGVGFRIHDGVGVQVGGDNPPWDRHGPVDAAALW